MKKKLWAGYVNDVIACTLEEKFGYKEQPDMPAIYMRKKDAKHRYADVRPVKIVEIKV